MAGLIYLLLCVGTGYLICRFCFPNMCRFGEKTYKGEPLQVSPLFLCLPAWFLFGTLPVTWLTYGIACIFGAKRHPLLYANLIVMPLLAVLLFLGLRYLLKREKPELRKYFSTVTPGEVLFFSTVLAFFYLLMFWTLFSRNDKLYVGWSVASDFAPHIGMIRSFAVGNNFPTSYSHFAGLDIKYHFMFQFLVGNLNYLGMRLDWAFNLPSILCMLCTYSLLYFYAVKLAGHRSVGYLTGLLLTFRSSQAFLDYAASISPKKDFFKTLLANTEFIGTTEHEDWGLWNLNVYCNQRHLAIGLSVLLLALIYFTKLLYDGTRRAKQAADEKLLTILQENPEEELLPGERAEHLIRESVFRREGWQPASLIKPAAIGLLLGLCSFFNGACVIGCLSVLFLMAWVSDRRLEYALTAALAVLLSFASTQLFISGSAVSPNYFFGFLADQKTVFGVVKYLLTLLGILPFVLLAAVAFLSKTGKYLTFAFLGPVILAFTTSLTIDITVNHKYVMIGVMLLCIPAAYLLRKLYVMKGLYVKLLSLLLVFALTISGFVDLRVVMKRNDPKDGNVMELDENSDICQFVMKNASSKDIFLTDWYSLNNFVLGGAMLYYGWPYYAWSAGYDTYLRERYVHSMYEAATPEMLDQLATACGIRFIVVDTAVRTSEEYTVNEDNILRTYGLVYNDGSTHIYDTRLKIYTEGRVE